MNFRLIADDKRCNGYSGADIQALVREASIEALKQRISGVIAPEDKIRVTGIHFETALTKIKPSISREEMEKYDKMKRRHCQT